MEKEVYISKLVKTKQSDGKPQRLGIFFYLAEDFFVSDNVSGFPDVQQVWLDNISIYNKLSKKEYMLVPLVAITEYQKTRNGLIREVIVDLFDENGESFFYK